MLDWIVNVNDPEQNGLLFSFDGTGPAIAPEQVRGNKQLAFSVRPVVESTTDNRPWDDDHLSTDTYKVAIGNRDAVPTAGDTVLTFGVALTSGVLVVGKWYRIDTFETGDDFTNVGAASNASGIIFEATGTTPTTWTNGSSLTQITESIAAGASAATVQAAILDADPSSRALTVTLLADGTYDLLWTANGAVPQLTSPVNDFAPAGIVSSLVEAAGSATTQAHQILAFRQSPVAFAEPTTQFPAAGVTATIEQAGSASPAANKIYSIALDAPGTYGGTYIVTITTVTPTVFTAGIATWNMSEEDFLAMLIAGTGLASTDFSVTRENDVLLVEFTGTQANSNVPLLAVTNVDLLAPKGVSGVINLNTFQMYRAFYATTADEITFTFAIRRTRVSGEENEFLLIPIVCKRNLIDVTSLVPATIPSPLYPTDLGILVPALRLDITDFTGGTAADLDGIAVTTFATGYILATVISGTLRFYQLQVSAAAEAAPGIIEPDDDSSRRWISML